MKRQEVEVRLEAENSDVEYWATLEHPSTELEIFQGIV